VAYIAAPHRRTRKRRKASKKKPPVSRTNHPNEWDIFTPASDRIEFRRDLRTDRHHGERVEASSSDLARTTLLIGTILPDSFRVIVVR